jgi:hypothetical protein
VSFSEPFQNGLCMDGVMHIGLDLGGGGGLVMPINDPPTFLVDTVAPEFDLYVNPPTVSITSPVVPVTEGLAGWPPLGGGIPKSGGSLLNTDVHWFIRKVIDPPLNQLNLRVYGHFVERRPVDVSGFEYAVTTSGFDPATAPAMTGSTPFAPTVTASPASGYLDVGWDFSGIADYGHWTFTPDARDRANNTVVVRTVAGGTAFTPLGHSLNAWWMPVPTAMFDASSTAPNQQTPNPQFSWKLTPSTGLTLQEEAPCFPIAGFQIWAVDPATQAYASLTGGWTWVDGAINKNTLVPTVGKSLLDILNDNRNNVSQSKQLFIAIRGGDEAGNVQPFNASLLGTSGSFEAGLAANGVDYRMWTNGASQGNVAVDTDLNVQLSHRVRATTGSDPVLRSFGSMARVPLPSLPEAKAGAYVNAQVSMGARYPELMNSTTTSVLVQVEWKLYEEGALVAQGRVKPQAYNQPYVFPLPQMLLGGAGDFNIGNATLTVDPAPDSRAFLRIGPDGLKNRMGDEASLTSPGRQRELRYMLVAQTVATIGSPTTTSQIIVDPTPATVEFSIYVREMLDKVREEQPVRIYERGQQNQ